MGGGDVSPEDAVITGTRPLPRLAGAAPLTGRRVLLTWEGGERKTVDLAPLLESRRIYTPLRNDDAMFRALRVSEHRDAIEWDGGLDLSALWLERLTAADPAD